MINKKFWLLAAIAMLGFSQLSDAQGGQVIDRNGNRVGNPIPASKIGYHPHNQYLPLSGGRMSGNLTTTNLYVSPPGKIDFNTIAIGTSDRSTIYLEANPSDRGNNNLVLNISDDHCDHLIIRHSYWNGTVTDIANFITTGLT